MESIYSADMFRKLSGTVWADHPLAREASYHFRSLAFRPHPGNILSFTCATLDLLQNETNNQVQMAMVVTLDRNLYSFQRDYPQQNISCIYQSLISAVERCPTEMSSLLINLGLTVAIRERVTSCNDFFNWSVQGLTHVSQDFPLGQNLKHVLETLKHMSTLISQHAELVTPDYVVMCCEFISLPLSDYPKTEKYEQPHQIKRRERITAEVKATNDLVSAAHDRAGRGLKEVINAVTKRKVYYSANELFSIESLIKLAEASPTGKEANVNAVMVRAIIEQIEQLLDSENPKPSTIGSWSSQVPTKWIPG